MRSDRRALSLDLSTCDQIIRTSIPVYSQPHAGLSVLFVVDQLTELGGGERALFQLAHNLELHGIHTIIVTFREYPDPSVFRLHPFIVCVPLGSCFSFRAVAVATELWKIIRDEQVQIVHTFFETSDLFGALIARIAGVQIIVSSRRDMGILRTRRHYVAYRILAPLYSAVIAVSNQVRQWHLQTDRLRHDQIHMIHNGLSLGRFDRFVDARKVRQKLHLPVDVPLITTVANINPWKGLDVFLNAAALIHIDHPTAAFCIAGDWTNLELVLTLKQQADLLGIASCVHFIGHVEDVAELLMSSDIFTLLSRSEGFPNVVLEAMAARLPIVATAVGGTPEAITDGVNGLLVENGDAVAAAEHISNLISDKALATRISQAGRQTVETNFSLDKMLQQHIELYTTLLTN